ncbi:MAG: ABC transporter substrate-binding protein [Polyangiaceae bacterium]|nr:ABC transporter substrate-binding protein [Polyangiaceae bacterium]
MHPPLSRRSLLAAFAATLAACGGKPPTVSNRPRVVSLSPSTTEAVFAVGGGYLLVGRSRFCDYPKEVESIAVVGGFADPNLEAILALAPTLVVGARGPAGPALAESLAARKIDTYFPETETLAQITEMITTLGRMLNHVTEARVTNQRIDILRKAVAGAVAEMYPCSEPSCCSTQLPSLWPDPAVFPMK